MTQLELFLQGGLGNQLIQLAYAQSLQARTGVEVRVNPCLLHQIWSQLRLISHRQRCLQWANPMPEVTGFPMQTLGFVRMYKRSLCSSNFTDSYSDEKLLQQITGSRFAGWHALLGYFQRQQAFDGSADYFWSYLKKQLLQRYSLTPFPKHQVAVHVRLGDYLWPQNKQIFARYYLSEQIQHAKLWSRILGDQKTIYFVTDEANTLRKLLADILPGPFVVYSSKSAEDDFIFLARHRHIVGSNSTFSLCCGKLAQVLWGEGQTLTIPPKWYVDKEADGKMQDELSKMNFICKLQAQADKT